MEDKKCPTDGGNKQLVQGDEWKLQKRLGTGMTTRTEGPQDKSVERA